MCSVAHCNVVRCWELKRFKINCYDYSLFPLFQHFLQGRILVFDTEIKLLKVSAENSEENTVASVFRWCLTAPRTPEVRVRMGHCPGPR